MKKTATLATLLATLATGSLQAQDKDPKQQEPARAEYQNQVLQQAPNQSDDAVARDPQHIGDLKVGAPAPHKYWRDDYAIQDLKKHHLPKPENDTQHWVKIGTDYVLLNNDTGTIQRIIKAK